MFSRYKKAPAQAKSAAQKPALKPVEAAPAPERAKPKVALRAAPKVAERQAGNDKEKRRRERLGEIKLELHKELLDNLNLGALESASEKELRTEITAIAAEKLEEMGVVLNREERILLNQELYDEVTGLGPLEPLLKDPTVNDILVNGPQQVFVERSGKLELTDTTFKDERHLLRIIDKIVSAVGRRVDESNPHVDARLQDGSRFNAMVPPIAVDGSLVSIRKVKKDKLGIDELVDFGAFSDEMAVYLQAAVATRLNIIVSGGTGSGKTTTLNALSGFIDNSERILTIEDTAELQLQQVHVGRMESRPANVEGKGEVSQRDCLRNALRMRPDRIIVGETRGEEVIDMLQAMNTGHDGSMTTIHANSARDAVSRLENMVAMAGIEMPLKAVRNQIASAVNLFVQISRLQDGSRRMVSITEITGMEGEVISMQEVFRYERLGMQPDGKIIGQFTATGVRSHFSDRFKQWGYDLPATIFEPVAAE
ncbi:MAG TPA: CpaF family protein [Aliiroseovarius sp.]|nr:CpaF family protein [Aliiroseovarius sp.]